VIVAVMARVSVAECPLRSYIDAKQDMSSEKIDWYGLCKVEEQLRSVCGGTTGR